MVMLASDDNNTEFVGAKNPDDILHVTFFKKPVINEFKTEKEGRPIFEDRDFIRIMNPGDQNSIIETYATLADAKRFPRHWAMYQNSVKEEDQVVGTPVKEWPSVTRSQAEELKAIGFFTVEQIAGASDLQIQKLGMMGNRLRQQARAYLLKASDTAAPSADAARVAALEKQVADLMGVVANFNAQANAPESEKPKRTMTQAQKDAMKAGREAAAKARQAA